MHKPRGCDEMRLGNYKLRILIEILIIHAFGWGKIKSYLKPTMLLSFTIAWFITNGWAYLLAFYPHPFTAVKGFALVYVGILYLPWTLEKPITVWIAVRIQRVFIKNRAMEDMVQYNKKYKRKLSSYYTRYNKFKEGIVYGRSEKYNYKRANFISGY